MSDMVHNTLKKLRKGNNSPVCYGAVLKGGGASGGRGCLRKGSVRGECSGFQEPVGSRKVVFFFFLCEGELAPTFSDGTRV